MKRVTLNTRIGDLVRQVSGHALVADIDASDLRFVTVDGVRVETGLWGGRLVSWDEEADGLAHDLIRKLSGKRVLITIDILPEALEEE